MKWTMVLIAAAALILVGSSSPGQFDLPAGLLLAIGLPLVAAVFAVVRRRTNVSQRWAGQAPGVAPLESDRDAAAVVAAGTVTVPVRFDPPRGLDAALSGVAVDLWPAKQHVSALMVELASRKHLSITKVEPESGRRTDYLIEVLDKTASPGLSQAATRVLEGAIVDARNGPVLLSEAERIRIELAGSATRLEVETSHWHRGPRSPKNGLGLPLAGLALLLMFFGGATEDAGSLLLAVAGGGVVAILIWWFLGRLKRVHTPEGTVASEQAQGFKTYLATAEASQLKFEEASEIFSRYLPYAVAFGVTKHWVKVFGEVRELAQDEGFWVPDPFLMPMFMIGGSSDFLGGEAGLGDGAGLDGADAGGGDFGDAGGFGDGDLFDVDSFTGGLDDFGGFLGQDSGGDAGGGDFGSEDFGGGDFGGFDF